MSDLLLTLRPLLPNLSWYGVLFGEFDEIASMKPLFSWREWRVIKSITFHKKFTKNLGLLSKLEIVAVIPLISTWMLRLLSTIFHYVFLHKKICLSLGNILVKSLTHLVCVEWYFAVCFDVPGGDSKLFSWVH